MVHHITAATSNEEAAGDAFIDSGPDFALLVDANAFLISDSLGNGVRLLGAGPWTATINGEVGAFGAGRSGMFSASTTSVTLTVGKTGTVFSGVDTGQVAIEFDGAATVVNRGTIAGDTGSLVVVGVANVTNAGLLVGDVSFGAGINSHDDIFTNFKKINGVIKNGTVDGIIDLGGGADHFNGGAKAETVRDAAGDDTYKFGSGNDTYIAFNGSGSNNDIVNGGKGIDTYDGSNAVGFLTVNLNTHTTAGDVGSDTVTNFENVIGGDGGCSLTGSSGANSLIGGSDNDNLTGLGGRDILTGGADGDTFRFLALADSGPSAATRDLITDFSQIGGLTVRDIIDISQIDAKTGVAGVQAFTLIGVQNFHGVKGELRESFNGGNTIVSGDINGDKHADFSFALKGHFLLTTDDFTNVL
jgi:Ca2+-binding RTX toxin-like protein